MSVSAPTQLATRSSNVSGQTSWATGSITFPAGSRGVLLFDNAGGSNYLTGVTDSAGNTWTVVNFASRASLNWTSMAFCDFPAGATCTVTTAFASSNETFGRIDYITGHDSTTGVDLNANAQTFGTSIAPSGVLGANDEYVAAIYSTGSAGAATTLPAGYTSLSAPSDAVRGFSATFMYRLVTGGNGTTETATATYSASRNLAAGLFSFKPAAGAAGQTVSPSAIASAEAIGTPTISPGPVTVSPSGVASAEAFGTARLDLNVAPAGIASAEAAGTPTITPGAVTVSPTGIASAEAVGQPAIGSGISGAGGIASEEAFGTPTISPGAVTVAPTGIPSAEGMGVPQITGGVAPAVGVAQPIGVDRPAVIQVDQPSVGKRRRR